MKTILFVCHGNICRSPAAEWIMKHLLKKYNLENNFFVYSRATSLEEIGNDIHPYMKSALHENGIEFEFHQARRITKQDYENADVIFYMDNNNLRYLTYLMDDPMNKFQNITKYTANLDYINDPWYSGKHEEVVEQLLICCNDIIKNYK